MSTFRLTLENGAGDEESIIIAAPTGAAAFRAFNRYAFNHEGEPPATLRDGSSAVWVTLFELFDDGWVLAGMEPIREPARVAS